MTNFIEKNDPDVWAAIADEIERQADGLEMIASENYTSPAVMQAAGSVLTNKYAEGYPGKRYYGGCQFVDVVEQLAIDRAKQLFGAEFANVQPHSGSQANTAIYLAALEPGDTVLGLDLAHGGHLTHGMKLNISGMLYHFVSYGVTRDTHRLDFDQIAALAREHKPKLIVAGASAYPREIPHDKFAEIAREVGAKLMVDMAHYAGLVAAGLHNNPVPVADFVTTTTHKTLRGPRAGLCLAKEEYGKTINSRVFPGIQGGPLMHVIAGKAVCFGEALQPEFKNVRPADHRQRQGAGRSAAGRRLEARQRRHRQSPDAGRRHAAGHRRQAGRGGARPLRHHDQQEHDPVRRAQAGRSRPASASARRRSPRAAWAPSEMRTIGGWMLEALRAPNDDADSEPHPRRDSRRCAQQFPVPAAAIEELTTETQRTQRKAQCNNADVRIEYCSCIVIRHSRSSVPSVSSVVNK